MKTLKKFVTIGALHSSFIRIGLHLCCLLSKKHGQYSLERAWSGIKREFGEIA